MSEKPIEGPARWSLVSLSATAMKVLAHPLRSRLLGSLRTEGPATATTLAERLGTNTGATSYHLRKLASVGLVEEIETGRGRERWWRPTSELHSFTDEAAEHDPDGRAAAGWLREHYLRMFVERAEAWLSNHDSWPLEWRRVAGSSDYVVELTASQLDALQRELWSVVARHRDAADAANAEARAHADGTDADAAEVSGPADRPQRVDIYFHGFPEGEAPR